MKIPTDDKFVLYENFTESKQVIREKLTTLNFAQLEMDNLCKDVILLGITQHLC